MPDRAYVQMNIMGGVSIHLAHEAPNGRIAIGLPAEITFAEVDDATAATVTEPALRMPESMARALCDALVAHFGGSTDVQTLRKDYLAERARVDKMIAHLTAGGAA